MITLDVDARGVATLTLSRQDKHNALSQAMIDDLTAMAARIAADGAIRVVVLAADGPTFCAGGDLGWMRDQMAADTAQKRVAAASLARMLQALNRLPQPLIGRIQGNAFGGGVGLACVCDIAIAAEGARFGLTETRLGLIPATIGPYVIARIGEAKARRIFMSSRVFGADEAVTLDLIARAVPAVALDATIAAEVDPYLSCGPQAVAAAKRFVRSLGPVIDEANIAQSIDALIACWDGDEARAGIAAFFDKRAPDWRDDR
ncbi:MULTISPECIES: crotonase/enoyl-CoA hydratase family protein [unclassified Yoonia]|uniref:crotonase/enoyl-CoA hydratase family protein n=1 Tax=unclassified Yoonia TaxID=2629118 RepID=UPI002AFF7712|nr:MULTISPECIES: crotonase/enoyl-CoA hydratase family protein [unclassified Yoonia]